MIFILATIKTDKSLKTKDYKMAYLVINNKIKFNISNLNAKELLKVTEVLKDYDLRLLRFS